MRNAQSQLVRQTQVRRLDLVRRYRAAQGCAHCGERDPACLDLHHVNGDKNPLLVRPGSWMHLSYDTIVEEISKCIVLCSNCHRKETRAQEDTRRFRVPLQYPSPGLLKAELALGLDPTQVEPPPAGTRTASNKGRPWTPEEREKHLAYRRTPEYRQRQSESAHKRWKKETT